MKIMVRIRNYIVEMKISVDWKNLVNSLKILMLTLAYNAFFYLFLSDNISKSVMVKFCIQKRLIRYEFDLRIHTESSQLAHS